MQSRSWSLKTFSRNSRIFSFLDLCFFTLQSTFFSFTGLHKKNRYEQINPKMNHMFEIAYTWDIFSKKYWSAATFAWLHSCKYWYVHNQYLPGLWKIRKAVTFIAWHLFIVQLNGSVYWLDLLRKPSIYYLQWAISKDKMDIFTMITGKVEHVWEFHSSFKHDLQKNIIKILLSDLTSGTKGAVITEGL